MILTLLLFILILGLIVFVHELGHFLWAKSFGVYIYEFSIGMGPVLLSKKGKDGINYNIRALPIGGFVSMAGEVYEDDTGIPKERFLCNKPVWQRVIVMAAGVINNFVLAIVLLLAMAFIWGSTEVRPIVESVKENYPFAEAGIKSGDRILKVNNYKVNSWDEVQLVMYYKTKSDVYTFKIKHKDGKVEDYKITPIKEKLENGYERKVIGVEYGTETKGFWNKIVYAFRSFGATVNTMKLTFAGLFTGKISVNELSGPVGIYSAVGERVKYGVYAVLDLVVLLTINVGVINILPFPAFDGGRIFFLLIEKIKGSPVNSKFENTCHTIGFILLMILIIYVTIHDIIKLF